MRTHSVAATLALFCLLSGRPALSQTAQVEVDPGHQRAAARLIEVMGTRKILADSLATTVSTLAQRNPQAAEYTDIFQGFFGKYMSWDALSPDLTKLYVQAFTEDELNRLTAFYDSELGRKVLTTMPDLTRKAIALGQARAQEHAPELQEALRRRMEEKKQKEQADPNHPATPPPAAPPPGKE